MAKSDPFNKDLNVINIGLSSFKENVEEAGAHAVQVDWKPPAELDKKILNVLSNNESYIEKQNKKCLEKILKGAPVLIDLDRAIDVIPGMKKNLILHAGPSITWERMCGPMRGAIIGALMYEGMAKNPKEAEKLASSGEIEYAPCHEHKTVGPMAGIVSASMPVFVLKNETFGNHAYCTMNEGLGKVLRYGAFSDDVVKKLKWMEAVLYPALKKAVRELGKIDLKNLIAQALHMGDEVHNRNRAATSLFYRTIAPVVIKTNDKDIAIKVLEFINGNDHFFLNLSMPACKVTLDAARNIKGSSVVVAMTRNGTDFGLQLSGTKNQWFVGQAPIPDALFFPGYTKNDANRDIGDSSITETNGLGGFAIAASPAIVQFIGGAAKDALNYSQEMYEITAGENNMYQIPALNFRGTPTGIDVIKVNEKGILPFIDTGVAHKKPGVGQVGAGVLSAPYEPFKKALAGFITSLDKKEKNK
ncbi:MAG: DUF1116 domain-containing protein [Candidatus Cloacimonetes bacterium]|nr:DUF1116 domain-containing protein [Candidatus Cloacimonadota bacterium]